MKTCDSLLCGTVISMDPQRHAYIDGYVTVKDGLIVEVGLASGCAYEATETLGGDRHIVTPAR